MVDLHIILPAWQTLAKTPDVNGNSGFQQRFLVCLAKTGRRPVEVYPGSDLKSVTAQKPFRARSVVSIAKPDHVSTHGPMGAVQGGLLIEGGQFAAAASSHNIGHQIVPQRSAGIG